MSIQEEASSLSLFLRSVRKVCFSVWENNAPRMNTLLTIDRADDTSQPDQTLPHALQVYRDAPNQVMKFRASRHTHIRLRKENEVSCLVSR